MDIILDHSNASMLYLHYLEKEILEKKVTPQNAVNLPRGLSGYYLSKLSEYFPEGDGYETYCSRVKPCLEAIAAGESTDISEQDLSDCFGANDMHERMASMNAMIVARPFMIKRGRMIEGKVSNMFVPFHLSFMDWLVGRDAESSNSIEPHRFQISAANGDVILAKWAEREFEKTKVPSAEIVPTPNLYWVRQGAEHLLRAFANFGSLAVIEKYDYLVKAVELLGWLNRFPQTSVIVARSLSLVSRILLQTTKNELDLTPAVLRALEPVDQQILFELVKDSGATEIIDNVLWWIGRTQLDHDQWLALIEQIQDKDEWVLRFGAARGQAARYKRLTDPKENLSEKERKWAKEEIEFLLNHEDLDYQELGATAVGEIAKTQQLSPQVKTWLKQLSASDLYFCQVILGDLMIHLMMSNAPSTRMVLELLDKEKIIEPFWNPIWKMTRQDVIRVLTLNEDKKIPWNSRRTRFEAKVKLAIDAFNVRKNEIGKFEVLAGSSGPLLAKILQKPEISSADQEEIIDWLKNVDTNQGISLAIQFLHLVFTHTSWRVLEKGSSIISEFEAQSHNQELCLAILDGLIDSLGAASLNALDPTGRVIYGTAEACYATKHFAGERQFEGETMPRLDYFILNYFKHPNCEVRGLLLENVYLLVREEIENQSANTCPDVTSLLMKYEKPIRRWLHDPDIWVLEHVYQLFQILRENTSKDCILDIWYGNALDHVRKKENCMLSLISREANSADPLEWVVMGREQFLCSAQQVRRRLLR